MRKGASPLAPQAKPKSDDDKLKNFKKCYDEATSAWKEHTAQFRKNYEAYMGNRIKKKSDDGREPLLVKHVNQQIETIVPRLVSPDPTFDVSPREFQDTENAKAVKYKLKYDLYVDDFVSKQVPIAKMACIFGVCIAKVVWSHQVETRTRQNFSVDPMAVLAGAKTTVTEDITVRNGPTFLPVNVFDFFPDPAGTSIESMRYVFHRSWLTDEDLEARAKIMVDNSPLYKNVDKVVGSGGHEDNPRLSNERPNDQKARRGGRHEVVEMWTKDSLLVVVDGQTIVRDTPNPFWHGKIPFVAATTNPDLDSFVGISEVELIENIQRMIWKMENLRIAAAEFSMNPTMLVQKSLKDGKSFQFRPGGRIFVDRMDQIEQMPIKDVGQAGWSEVNAYLGYMQQVSGVSPYIAGADPNAMGVNQATATGASILQTEANKRLGLKLLQIQTMYSKAARMFVQLNQQFMTKSEVVRIVGSYGEQWVELKPQDIAGEYDVICVDGTESLAKAAEMQRLTEAINTLMPMHGVPMADGTVVDISYPLRKLLENIGVDPDRCFVQNPQAQPPAQMPHFMERQQLAQGGVVPEYGQIAPY